MTFNHWDNVEAIDRYIKNAPLNTKAAGAIRDEWTRFFDEFSWSYATQEQYDRARNLRNRFNLANAVTQSDKEQVLHVMQTGLTTEELAGGTSRRLIDGSYIEPLLTAETKAKLVFGGVIIAGAFVLFHVSRIANALRP